MSNCRRRIFCDMDGTVAVWQKASSYEDLLSKGYFLKLPPVPNMVNAVKLLAKDAAYEVFILSAVLEDSLYALREKNAWLDRHLPEIDAAHRIFTLCGADKADCVPDGIRENDVLLDDFSQNLLPWSKKAVGVKVLNGINGNFGSWAARNGLCVHADWNPEEIKTVIDKM